MSLESRFQVSLSINGVDYGIWDSKSGGGVEAEVKKYQPGGADVPPVSLKNKKKPPEDITITRYYSVTRDHAQLDEIEALVGNGDCVLTTQPLDANDNPLGDPKTNRGTLQAYTPPDVDSESDDTAKAEVVISTIA